MFSGTCDVLSVKTQIGDLCIADQSLIMQISMVLRHPLQNNLGIETLVTNQMLPEQSIFSATHVLTPDCVCDSPTYRNTLFLWCLSFDSRPRHRDGRLDPLGWRNKSGIRHQDWTEKFALGTQNRLIFIISLAHLSVCSSLSLPECILFVRRNKYLNQLMTPLEKLKGIISKHLKVGSACWGLCRCWFGKHSPGLRGITANPHTMKIILIIKIKYQGYS